MSLETLSTKELDLALEFFGAENKKGATKAQKITALTDQGVDYAQYQKFLVPDEVEVVEEVVETPEGDLATVDVLEPVAPAAPVEDNVLMIMERRNPTYEVMGYRFTKQHPFQLVKESDANKIMMTEKGFRPAMPAEAREYYG